MELRPPPRISPRPLVDMVERSGMSTFDDERFEREFGFCIRTYQRYKKPDSTISYWKADRIATHLGVHPSTLWDEFD